MSDSMRARSRLQAALPALADELARAGARLALRAEGVDEIRIGPGPARARVIFHCDAALAALARRDHLALAEAYLDGRIDVEGDLLEVMRVTDLLALQLSWRERLGLGLRLLVKSRVAYDRESISFHYDRPVEFFLPWLDRWRSYSHGFYASPQDSIDDAQARKLGYAIDALGLEPGMNVFDMGGGWGCFVEYAGLRGICVHTITISREQHRFVRELIREKELPCTVELVNFRDYQPPMRFDGAVFMGTLEHNPEYERTARFLDRWLEPGARVYADFCAQRASFQFGSFMKKHIWPGPITYVNPWALTRELMRAGFNVHELVDDTLSYALTTRDWARALDAHRKPLAERFGEPAVRAFLLFLYGSYHFLRENRTQAYHLVAGREPAGLCDGRDRQRPPGW